MQQTLALENNFTPSQIKEREQFVIEKEYSDSNIDIAQDLYNAGLLAFEKLKVPSPLISIDIVNFLEIVECQNDWDKLNLGDTVTIYYPQFETDVEAMIVEMDFNFDEDGGTSSTDNQCVLTLSNFRNVLTDEQRLLDLIYQSSGSSTTVDMSKYKWDAVDTVSSQVQSILQNTWDANARAITAGINETVRLDNRGLTITDPNDTNNYLVATHSILAITNDGGQTWKEAITSSGISATQLYGQVIMGENLTIGSDDGLLNIIGNKVTVYDRNNNLAMAMGLYDTISGVDKFGIKLYGQNMHVFMDSVNGFQITTSDEKTVLFGANGSGGLTAQNINVTGNIDANTFTVNGKNALTNDNQYIDGSILQNVNASTINTGSLNANTVTVKSTLNNGGYITLGSSGFTVNNGTENTVTIDMNGKSTWAGDIDTSASINVGESITLGSGTTASRSIIFNDSANITSTDATSLNISAEYTYITDGHAYIGSGGTYVTFGGNVDFSQTASVTGLTTDSQGAHNHGMTSGVQYLYGHYDNSLGQWVIDGSTQFVTSGAHTHSVK